MTDLTITTADGNSTINGAIKVDNTTHNIKVTSSNSERGSHAVVDGAVYWWYGPDANDDNPEIEEAVDNWFSSCVGQIRKAGMDPDGNWIATIKNDSITEIAWIDPETGSDYRI